MAPDPEEGSRVSTTEQEPVAPEIEPMPVAVRFAARGRHLTLERVHPRRHVDASGNAVWQQGLNYEFEEFILTVYPGQDKIADKFDTLTGEMHEQDAIEWLRSHELYGTDRGFWELAPVAPDPAPLLQRILQLAVQAGNPETREKAEEALVNIHEVEADSWKREAVLNACKAALAAVESNRALSEPEPVEAPQGATRETLVPPPPPDPDLAPHTRGEREWSLEGGFNPDSAPTTE
jgi:hypothetical protein